MWNKAVSFFRVTFLWILLLPVAFIFVGAASNQVVLIANHDKFPVMLNATKLNKFLVRSSETDESQHKTVQHFGYFSAVSDGMIDDVHCVMTSETHLNFLADIFDLGSIYSIGDGLLELGEWLGGFCQFVWLAIVILKLREAY